MLKVKRNSAHPTLSTLTHSHWLQSEKDNTGKSEIPRTHDFQASGNTNVNTDILSKARFIKRINDGPALISPTCSHGILNSIVVNPRTSTSQTAEEFLWMLLVQTSEPKKKKKISLDHPPNSLAHVAYEAPVVCIFINISLLLKADIHDSLFWCT